MAGGKRNCVSTILTDDREAALHVGYAATDWIEAPSFERYRDALRHWTVRLMVRDGKWIGAVFTNGPEFHVSVLKAYRGTWATRSMLKQVIPEPVAMTRVTPGFAHVAGLLERLGFERRPDGAYVKEPA